MERDFVAEMCRQIDAATSAPDWIPAVVAQKLHAQLAETDPELLDGWLHAMAEHMLASAISLRVRRDRSLARTRAQSRAFGRAAAEGDAEALSLFTITHRVNGENLQRRAADMTGPDHLFVARDYRAQSAPLLLMAAFHEAIAKKLGKRKTSDVFTEAEYDRLFRSITRAPEGAVA